MTRNRMPRWLSEGISVYEELERNPAWGQLMSLDYRDRILTGRTQPISRMSAAFLQAESGEDVQFAYYQSYLVVDFLVAEYGFEALRAVLAALGDGMEMNTALAANIAPLDELDAAFTRHARARASALGGRFDLAVTNDEMSTAIASVDPNNFAYRLRQAREAMEEEDWAAARTTLEELTSEGLYLPGPANAHAMLARVARELEDAELERAALTTITEHESDAVDAIARLLELANEAEDWDATAHWADYWLAVNPLATTPWRTLLAVHERRENADAAVAAGDVLLKLDPPDRAAIHYRVARLLQPTNIEKARLHVLEALEDAPRFRDAHVLLSALPAGPGVDGPATPPEPEIPAATRVPTGLPESLRPTFQ
jgi:tetratricopeptide (TPR) repeat protein